MRLIDADALLKRNPFTKIGGCLSEYNEGFLDCAEEAREAVKNAPTINPNDLRPHGWWTETNWAEHDGHGEVIALYDVKTLRCSSCCCCFKEELLWRRNYCPNCGVKMAGKEHHK